MQIVVKNNTVIATYADDVTVPIAAFPGAVVLPHSGEGVVLNATPPAIDLAAYAKSVRYAKEVGGVAVNGLAIATDDRAKTLLLGARISAATDATFTTPWSFPDGTEQVLDAATVIAASNAVLAHVAGCFSTYSTVKAGIDAGTIKTTADVDAAFAAAA